MNDIQQNIIEHLMALKPRLKKSTWDDIVKKMRSHSPDIYAEIKRKYGSATVNEIDFHS
jgi:hypothetical protein